MIYLLVILFSLISNKSLSQTKLPFSDPDNQGGWIINNTISDEFNGNSLDTNKWNIQGQGGVFQNNFVGRAPSQFSPANVQVENNQLIIYSKWQPDYNFSNKLHLGRNKYEKVTTGAIISKQEFLNGYMEIKCKAADGPVSSSFWCIGRQGEIDVFEHFGQHPKAPKVDRTYHTSFYNWQTPGAPNYGKRVWDNKHLLPYRVADETHVYGLEWNSEYIKLYVDGRLIHCITKAEVNRNRPNTWVPNAPCKVWVDSETFPFFVSSSQLSASDFPGNGRKFIVDYVRVWSKNNANDGCETRTNLTRNNLITNSGFEDGTTSWVKSGNAKIITNNSTSYSGSKFISVSAGSNGTIEQQVTVKPNTTYVLSAYVKSPGTNDTNIYHDAWIGVRNYGGSFETMNFFHNYWHRKSIQFKTGPTNTTANIFFTNQWSKEPAVVDYFELHEASSTAEPIITPPPSTKEKFYIVNRLSKKKIRPVNDLSGAKIIQTPQNTVNSNAQWEKIDLSNGWFYLKNVQSGMYFRPQTKKNGSALVLVPTTSASTDAQWKQVNSNDGYFYLENRETGKFIKPRNKNNNVNVIQLPSTSRGDWTQWKFVPISNTNKKTNANKTTTKDYTKNVLMYPNPATNFVNIEIDNIKKDIKTSVSLYSLDGKLILNQIFRGDKTTIRTSSLNKGVYILKVDNTKKATIKKLIIN
ncbi:hypothetical protein A8C32_17315 [Flavivirga aquatica]|uniref:GH16 domain-containing protein n=2 Tax=Flavivirga aquatica TaxID=1849968 RepID=A0A1E5T885_9FLAO|nr:hypothetical protein A8C32_17315 [Flavivirga aquatica]